MDEDDVMSCIESAAEALMKRRREGWAVDGPTTPNNDQINMARGVVSRFLAEADGSTTVEELRQILGIET